MQPFGSIPIPVQLVRVPYLNRLEIPKGLKVNLAIGAELWRGAGRSPPHGAERGVGINKAALSIRLH